MIKQYLTPEELQERANEFELTVYSNTEIQEKINTLEKAFNETQDPKYPQATLDAIASLQRVETMDGDLQKSISWVGFSEDLEKAMQHKYFKREGTPGNYKYYYTEAEYKEAKGSKGESKETPKTEAAKKYEQRKEKFEKLVKENKKLYDDTLSLVLKDDKAVYKITSLDTGESREFKPFAYGKDEYYPPDKAAQKMIAGSIAFPELGFKVEKIKEKTHWLQDLGIME